MYWTYNIQLALEYIGKPKSADIPQYHFSNHSICEVLLPDGIRDGVQEMICCFEDTNIEGFEQAKETCQIIAALMPNQWVMIDTGDYITSKLPWEARDDVYYLRETYDPHYHIYLVHVDIFTSCREQLEQVDAAWRKEKQEFADSKLPVAKSEQEEDFYL